MKKILFIFACLLSTSVLAALQNAPILPVDVYADLPKFSMARLSPSGQRILFRAVDGDKDIMMIKELSTGKLVGGVVLGEVNPSGAFFIDEDRVILQAYKYKKLHGYRGRHNVSTAYVYDVNTNNIVQLLVPGLGIYHGQTGLGHIVGISEDKTEVYMPAYTGIKTLDNPPYSLVKVKLDTKRSREPRIVKRGRNEIDDYFVDSQGEIIAIEAFNNRDDLHTIDSYISGEKVEIFSQNTAIKRVSFVGLTPDKQSLVMIKGDEHGGDSYYTMSLHDGKVTGPIFVRPGKEIDYVLSDINRVVYGVRYSGFKPSYEFFNKQVDNVLNALQKQMPNNVFYIQDHSADWQSILLLVEGEGSPQDYYLYNKETGFQFLASARKGVDPAYVNPVLETSITARDGLAIPTLITSPVGVTLGDKPLPTVVMPHGGPESYDKYGFDYMAQFLANRGYLVIQPQFRGSRGFGADHTTKGYGQWGQAMQTDLDDALAAMVEKSYADKDRTCMLGWSYGGYASLTAAVSTPQMYKCIIAINGVSDLEEMLSTERREHGSDHWIVSYWNKAMRDSVDDSKLLERYSPINHVHKVQAPVLVIAGEHDKVVPVKQSRNMVEELEDANKDVTYIELENEGHSIINNNTSRTITLTAIEKFLDKHL
ncbi:alpha/beta hydrolase family protein [Pseudoalteromonas sp. SSDWG2]|uniref:alpha/beta hydrolase family protein n=1 Tax=Pseudoalteromonas sp. SSDWG2 TaxID=3139391 RepID=UPI003BAC3A82